MNDLNVDESCAESVYAYVIPPEYAYIERLAVEYKRRAERLTGTEYYEASAAYGSATLAIYLLAAGLGEDMDADLDAVRAYVRKDSLRRRRIDHHMVQRALHARAWHQLPAVPPVRYVAGHRDWSDWFNCPHAAMYHYACALLDYGVSVGKVVRVDRTPAGYPYRRYEWPRKRPLTPAQVKRAAEDAAKKQHAQNMRQAREVLAHLLYLELERPPRMGSMSTLELGMLRVLASPKQGKAIFARIMRRVAEGPYNDAVKAGTRALINALRKGKPVA